MAEPWEKTCPKGYRDHFAVVRDLHGKLQPCEECHGTGAVPMTTSEMLEALSERDGIGASLERRPAGWAWVGPDRKRWNAGKSPDDALRAALGAVSK